MADSKQEVPLKVACFGPPAPPPSNTSRSVGRSCSLCCGPCCLVYFLIKLIVYSFIAVAILLFVTQLIFRPNDIQVQVYVESASLTHFSLANNNTTLNYDLALDVSIRNPNTWVGFYYDYVEARAIYNGSWFAFDTLPTFYQDRMNTTVLHSAFNGAAGALGAVSGAFNRESVEGNFYVEVKIYSSVRLKTKFVTLGIFRPEYDCVIKLPVPSGKTAAGSFERIECDVDVF